MHVAVRRIAEPVGTLSPPLPPAVVSLGPSLAQQNATCTFKPTIIIPCLPPISIVLYPFACCRPSPNRERQYLRFTPVGEACCPPSSHMGPHRPGDHALRASRIMPARALKLNERLHQAWESTEIRYSAGALLLHSAYVAASSMGCLRVPPLWN